MLISKKAAGDAIDLIYQTMFFPGAIAQAQAYLEQRGIPRDKTSGIQCAISSPFPGQYENLRDIAPPVTFTDCLFIPIADVEDPKVLAGFDIRHIGVDKSRVRFVKYKRSPQHPLLYTTKPFELIDPSEPLFVTEAVIDAESLMYIRGPNTAVVSSLTAQHGAKFIQFLLTLSDNIWFAYDYDNDGRNAIKRIMDYLEPHPDLIKKIHILYFQGKDVNQSLQDFGVESLRKTISAQV